MELLADSLQSPAEFPRPSCRRAASFPVAMQMRLSIRRWASGAGLKEKMGKQQQWTAAAAAAMQNNNRANTLSNKPERLSAASRILNTLVGKWPKGLPISVNYREVKVK